MTRADLRSTLASFRSMVRERGPWECMEVACLMPGTLFAHKRYPWGCETDHDLGVIWLRLRMPRLAARAVARWWRWANRYGRYLELHRRLPIGRDGEFIFKPKRLEK